MRVAIVHYWLLGMRGGERVVESFAACCPPPISSHSSMTPSGSRGNTFAARVIASYLNPRAGGTVRFYR